MQTLSRRKTLALIGGGTILAATASAGTFLTTRTPRAALAPWDAAGGYADPRMDALSYALLAPNPHNRQPWEAELTGADGITLWRDPARNLPVTDPFDRQLTIGMGCFLELCRMAAAARGFATETVLFPEGETGPVARLTLVEGGRPDPLFAHVMERRSHKEAFEARPVGGQAAPLAEHATLYLDGPDRDALRDHALDAWLTEAETPAAFQESIDLLRIGKAEINAQPDGIDLGGPMMDSLALAGILTREAAADLDNPGTRDAIESTAFAIAHAPAITLTTTPGNTRADQIEAGRLWLRLNLAATGAGLALRPVSQALQEYPEVLPIREAVHDRFAPEGGTVQMLGLLGYGERTPRTPRWPLETRLRHA
ncbi:MAG: twin-arginine translocation pathway signal protein [Pseudomonadota bacterium]